MRPLGVIVIKHFDDMASKSVSDFTVSGYGLRHLCARIHIPVVASAMTDHLTP